MLASLTPSLPQSLSGGRAEGAGAEGWASATAPGVDPAALAGLASTSVSALADTALSAADLGIVASAIHRGIATVPACEAQRTCSALAAACTRLAGDMDWRGVAAAELALRHLAALGGARERPVVAEGSAKYSARLDRSATPAMRRLASRAVEACAAVTNQGCELARSALQLLLRTLEMAAMDSEAPPAWSTALRGGGEVLLVGGAADGGQLAAALLAGGSGRIAYWCRFASDARAAPAAEESTPLAAAWPRAPSCPSGLYAAAVMRVPASADALAFAADAVASVLCPGGTLLLLGLTDEGATEASLQAALGPPFEGLTTLATSPEGSAGVWCVRRRSSTPPAKGSATAWRSEMMVELTPKEGAERVSPLRFVVFPGFFAGGGLDVMSEALLSCIPLPPAGSRVLDFGCGSGALSASLLLREPRLIPTLLDADALAVAAATENMRMLEQGRESGLHVPRMRATVLLSDGFSALDPDLCFDLIVSNPPVHSGSCDDFRVLIGLLEGAPRRLRGGGSLWIVAQAQVPVGRLAAAAAASVESSARTAWRKVRPVALANGRFVAWHLQAQTDDECLG